MLLFENSYDDVHYNSELADQIGYLADRTRIFDAAIELLEYELDYQSDEDYENMVRAMNRVDSLRRMIWEEYDIESNDVTDGYFDGMDVDEIKRVAKTILPEEMCGLEEDAIDAMTTLS